MPYDDDRYAVRKRKWFGLGPYWGGEGNPIRWGTDPVAVSNGAYHHNKGGFFLGTHDPGTITHVGKWFPGGPIEIRKIGVFVCSTSNNASGGLLNFQFLTRGASASVAATMRFSSCTVTPGAIAASKSSFTVKQCKAGEYITIKQYEGQTLTSTGGHGTEVKSTTSGRVAFFIDYIPQYDKSGRWD